ncbi:MAG: hypothetical protein HY506_01885 [Candidatus Yanofskybacteria bacterium]|nr:hypothetical protein [Candidatus Yanofskybacteria bacterium]
MEEILKNFGKQLEYAPTVQNIGEFHKKNRFIVCGMGGSNLAAGIIESWKPELDIAIHRDYGLPYMSEVQLKESLIVASSYSGNTEETVSAYEEARSRRLSIVVIAAGGKLLELAQENGVPYLQMPTINAGPRFAVGLSIKATLKAMGEDSMLNGVGELTGLLKIDDCERTGEELAGQLHNKIPLIYSSGTNTGLARYWKISFNESSKLPAFYNFLPELNHNEMVGFDRLTTDGLGSKLADRFAVIFLNDPDTDPRVLSRLEMTKKILADKGVSILNVGLAGPSPWYKSFANILTAMWTSYHLAKHYGVDPENISMVEDFKKSLSSNL